MKPRPQPDKPRFDHTEWTGKFAGYNVLAFGRWQRLHGPVGFRIRQEFWWPGMWIARAVPGEHEPVCIFKTPEECMRHIEDLFDTQIEQWQAWTGLSLWGNRKITPQLVARGRKKVG